jgi:hypothetical protein
VAASPQAAVASLSVADFGTQRMSLKFLILTPICLRFANRPWAPKTNLARGRSCRGGVCPVENSGKGIPPIIPLFTGRIQIPNQNRLYKRYRRVYVYRGINSLYRCGKSFYRAVNNLYWCTEKGPPVWKK